MENIQVRQTPLKGRGVFALRPISAGEILEVAEVILIFPEERTHLDQTELFSYYFRWGDDGLSAAIALGYGSLYNHSYTPNAAYKKDFAARNITFVALRAIAVDEEITVNYNGDPHDRRTVSFPVA